MKRASIILILFLALGAWFFMPRTHAAPTGGVRIAALAPSVASTLRAFGLQDHIVARHGFDPVPHIPSAGDQAGLDHEVLVAVHPTHVYVSHMPVDKTLDTLAARYGWLVRDLTVHTLDEVLAFVETLWKDMLDVGLVEGENATLQHMQDAFDQSIEFDGTVLLIVEANPYGAPAAASYHNQLLVRLGLTPAITADTNWVTLFHEDLLALAPDAIIALGPESLLDTIRTLDLPATRTGHLAALDDLEYQMPGPRLADFADDLVRIFDSWTPPEVAAIKPE
ncbi:MAG: hypothetical protein KDA28_01430 [Phycisphaerales bacterium]|nr:hypothetical protein [Phycisphaerales bacterium]